MSTLFSGMFIMFIRTICFLCTELLSTEILFIHFRIQKVNLYSFHPQLSKVSKSLPSDVVYTNYSLWKRGREWKKESYWYSHCTLRRHGTGAHPEAGNYLISDQDFQVAASAFFTLGARFIQVSQRCLTVSTIRDFVNKFASEFWYESLMNNFFIGTCNQCFGRWFRCVE